MPWTETTRPHYERRCPRHASDLTDEEWALIEPLIPLPNRIGRPRKTDLREVVIEPRRQRPRLEYNTRCVRGVFADHLRQKFWIRRALPAPGSLPGLSDSFNQHPLCR
jgi:hypothetical protein